jgi:hypothetical protein
MKKITLFILVIIVCNIAVSAAQLFNDNGVKLNHTVIKETEVFVHAMNKNVIIWKSTFELTNDSKKAIAIRIPCYLTYAYAYLNPAEISMVQKYVPEFKLSDAYKNYVAEKPRMVNAKHRIISEKYFATIDNVDLRSATMNWDFKFNFWY